MELNCGICSMTFDGNDHRPKCLPCGHTICKECVQSGKCPACNEDFSVNPCDHPDNVLVIQMMECEVEPPSKKIKIEDTRPEDGKLQQLQRGVDAGRELVQQLRQLVPIAAEALTRLHDTTAAQLRQMEEALEQQLRGREKADVGEETAAPPPEPQLQLAVQLEESLRLLSSHKCSLLAEEEGGATWKATLEPVDHILHLLLVQARANDQLKMVDADSTSKAGEDAAEFDDSFDVHVRDHSEDDAEPTPFVGPPGIHVLRISRNSDLDNGSLNVNNILKDKLRWLHARSLLNVQGLDSEGLLRVLAPQLEELEIKGAASPAVMEEVRKMKSLKRLMVRYDDKVDGYPELPLQLEELLISSPSTDQLRCVQRMPRLRSLSVLNYRGDVMSSPPLCQHAGLTWLKVAIPNTETVLSLIHAHSSSLRQLEIFCGANKDCLKGFYFPDLGESLSAHKFPALNRLVLRRPNAKCDKIDDCLIQLRSIRCSLNNSAEVVCDVCTVI